MIPYIRYLVFKLDNSDWISTLEPDMYIYKIKYSDILFSFLFYFLFNIYMYFLCKTLFLLLNVLILKIVNYN